MYVVRPKMKVRPNKSASSDGSVCQSHNGRKSGSCSASEGGGVGGERF